MTVKPHIKQDSDLGYRPLAELMRPQTIDEFIGQVHLIGPGKPLREAIVGGHLHSMVLWGPPGSGKTTLARLMAQYCGAHFLTFSAVTAGVKDIREVVAQARNQSGDTILFVDEVHRFNKAQQDAFLPHVEDGTIILIGATTENPSFELNNALLSRLRVYVLRALEDEDLCLVFDRAFANSELVAVNRVICIENQVRDLFVAAADGDARRILNFLEVAVQLAAGSGEQKTIDEEIAAHAIGMPARRFDKGGDYFYDQISALHKSVRGTDPDAALYWLARMLDGGCDPRYVARRLIRMASEDIGNADPRALALTLDAAEAYERLGSPEGELALAQATVFLACAAKSNATYRAFGAATQDAVESGTREVPLHLRNAPTALAKQMGHSKGYRYAHDEEDAYAPGENYFPKGLEDRQYYHPVDRGLEARIAEKLTQFRARSRKA
jgi:putative ATPase